MLIRHLSFFIALAEERHFARAAERSNVTQPTLSAAIKKLEDDLRVTLVVRSHHFVGLTPEGQKVLAWGRQILADYHSLHDDLAGSREGMTGALRLGVIPAAMPAVAFVTSAFAAANPAAMIEIRSLTSRMIAQGLDGFDLDGGLTYLNDEPIAHVRSLPLYRERYLLMVPRNHRLSGRDAASWSEAAGEPLCLLSQDMQNRRILDRLAASAGAPIHPPIVANSFLAILSHLRVGGWASIVPHTFLHLIGPQADLNAIAITEPDHSEAVGLVVSDREPRSPMVAALLAVAAGLDLSAAFAT
jgi:DNA-binding transcriptional LysR family regulator